MVAVRGQVLNMHFPCIILFNPCHKTRRQISLFILFYSEKTEAHRSGITCPNHTTNKKRDRGLRPWNYCPLVLPVSHLKIFFLSSLHPSFLPSFLLQYLSQKALGHWYGGNERLGKSSPQMTLDKIVKNNCFRALEADQDYIFLVRM